MHRAPARAGHGSAVLGTGRHLLLEGPVGVGKTTVALAVLRGHLERSTVRVDGDDRYSESKLTLAGSTRRSCSRQGTGR